MVTLELYQSVELLLDENNGRTNGEIEYRLKCFELDTARLGCRHAKPSSGYAGVRLILAKNELKQALFAF